MADFIKDPDAVLDYAWDWSSWLAEGETISSAEVAVTGATLDDTLTTSPTVTAWLSGGTVGSTATARCRVTTNAGRTDDRTISLQIKER